MLIDSKQSTEKSGEAVGVLETSFDSYDSSSRIHRILPINHDVAKLVCSTAHEAYRAFVPKTIRSTCLLRICNSIT